jgi:uncharacterized protein
MERMEATMDGRPSIRLLVIQPTPFCNLDCDYCYLPHRNDTRKITLTALERLFTKVFESGLVAERLTVIWHAGEPMVMPIAFYREAFALAAALQPKEMAVEHAFQTNGVLIDQNWCDFIKKSGLRVGVSIDGPQFLHDTRRKTRTGRGTHLQVMKGIRLLQDNGIDFHVITVLTQDSLQFPDELFDFYLANGLHRIAFNIEEIEGVHRTSTLAVNGIERQFIGFMTRFWALVKKSPSAISVREFESAIAAIARPGGLPVDNPQVEPFAIVSVDCVGNISTFSPELLGQRSDTYGDFTFGNIHSGALSSMQVNPNFLRLSHEIQEGVKRCRESCSYFSVCGGGAPANKFYEHGSFEVTETLYCRLTKKALCDLVLDEMERALTAG